MSRMTIPVEHERPFHCISTKRTIVRATRITGHLSLFINVSSKYDSEKGNTIHSYDNEPISMICKENDSWDGLLNNV